jgi:hypothetical protein
MPHGGSPIRPSTLKGTQVLRLDFKPVRVTAGQTILTERKDLNAPGYTLETAQSDFIVRLRPHRFC